MKPDFETKQLVGWRAFSLAVSLDAEYPYVEFRPPVRYPLGKILGGTVHRQFEADHILWPDVSPTDCNLSGLYFWAYDFRMPVRPLCEVYDTSVGPDYFPGVWLTVAARVVVPPGHYAIVARNAVGRASGLMIDRIIFPRETRYMHRATLRSAYARAEAMGLPVTVGPDDAAVVMCAMEFRLPRLEAVIHPAYWYDPSASHHDAATDGECWRDLRHYMTTHGII
jgi:hypothetical protein